MQRLGTHQLLYVKGRLVRMVEVAVAVIVKDGRVLIAQRREDDGLPVEREFPGGKVEEGETPEECLVKHAGRKQLNAALLISLPAD